MMFACIRIYITLKGVKGISIYRRLNCLEGTKKKNSVHDCIIKWCKEILNKVELACCVRCSMSFSENGKFCMVSYKIR